MTDILPNQKSDSRNISMTKKSILRVDLTPMVDLGFLLISFFILTTTIALPTSMKLAIPDDNTHFQPSEIPESKTLNIILGQADNFFTYDGVDIQHIQTLGRNIKLLREKILEKKEALRKKFGSDKEMLVLIKPTEACSYADVVNVLDEMMINDVKTYIMTDAAADEVSAVKHITNINL
ncbi:MAG: biopolymer transporter ExbD [Bacteroidetes bacterium]|nr:biopolymer transporter ExbD [Bacteroidota bacterium]